MAATVTAEISLDTFAPVLVQTLTVSQRTRSIVHDIVGSAEPYISFQPAALRTGQHVFFFASESEAMTAQSICNQIGAFTLSYPERPWIEMRFVVADGSIDLDLDPTTRKHWTLTVSFQELSA
jgi:hypothetical protein